MFLWSSFCLVQAYIKLSLIGLPDRIVSSEEWLPAETHAHSIGPR